MNKNETKFINDVNNKYGIGVYLFDKMIYVNAHKHIELLCTKHNGYFTITPKQMLRASSKGCNHCTKNTPYTTEEFIKKCKINYGTKLTYEKTKYINQKHKVIVTCVSGDHDWEVNPVTLLKGKSFCGICSGKSGRNTSSFVLEAKRVHGEKYNYDKVEYIHSENYVTIICNIHGDFTQQPKAHLTGRGCPKCGKYGYQPSQPGYFYVQKLTYKNEVLYKYGITGDLERRILEQSRHSVYKHEFLYSKLFDDGNKPLVLEKFIKNYIPSGVITSCELSSGFSETFRNEYLEAVMEIVNNFE